MKERRTGRALVLGLALTALVGMAACKGDAGKAAPTAGSAQPQKVDPKIEAPPEPKPADPGPQAAAPEPRKVETPAPTPNEPTRRVNPLATARVAVDDHAGHDHAAGDHAGHDHAAFDPATGRPLQRDGVRPAQAPEGVDAVKDFDGTKIALIHTANRVGEFDPCG